VSACSHGHYAPAHALPPTLLYSNKMLAARTGGYFSWFLTFHPAFPQFSKFPEDLKIMIWNNVCSQPQSITLVYKDDELGGISLRFPAPAPSIFHVNRTAVAMVWHTTILSSLTTKSSRRIKTTSRMIITLKMGTRIPTISLTGLEQATLAKS